MATKKELADVLGNCTGGEYRLRKAEFMRGLLQEELKVTDEPHEREKIQSRILYYNKYIAVKSKELGLMTMMQEKSKAAAEAREKREAYERLTPMQQAALLIMDVKFRIPHMTKEITIQPGHTATVWRSYAHHYEQEAV